MFYREDVESFVLSLVIDSLGLDSRKRKEIGIELAKKYLNDGKNSLIEILYKLLRSYVKVLAIHFNLSEVLSRVGGRGGWSGTDLIEFIRAIARELGPWFIQSWDTAWVLHIWGFHEGKLGREDIVERIPYIEKVVEKTIEIVSSKNKSY